MYCLALIGLIGRLTMMTDAQRSMLLLDNPDELHPA